MNQQKGKFVKGMMTGAVVGATTTMIVEPMLQKKKHKKANMSHTFKRVGNTVGTVVDSFMNMK